MLAHSLSVVTVHAGVGRRVGATQPAEALRALRTVEEASRGALDELRRVVCLLRSDEPAGTGDAAAPGEPLPALAPVPGLSDLDGLVTRVRKAGTPVQADLTGDAAAVPAAAGMTAYRIVQEALTNVVRHAPGATATVRVSVVPSGVRIRVTDTGPPAGPASAAGASSAATAAGHGIAGMRERAAIFGGTLDAGPLPGGGFQVAAFLPVQTLATGRVA